MVARARFARWHCSALLLVLSVVLAATGCDKMQLTAPSESTIQLFPSANSLPLHGSVEIVGTVTEESGTPVQNGTVVVFTTTLGRIDPAEARTNNGRVSVRLFSDDRSGTATVTAVSGGATSEAVEIPVGAAAAGSVVVRANPATVGASGGSVEIIATVLDESGNPIAGVPVAFSTTAGQLAAATVTTDANGDARTTLTTSSEATVTARAGGQEAETTVTVQGTPTVAVTVTPDAPVSGEPVTFAITVTPATNGSPVESMRINFGDGESQEIGNGSTTVAHVYANPGTYTVTIRIRDAAGEETSQVTVIVVSAP